MSANDPQIQLAEDVADKLNFDANPASLLTNRIDISKSLAPFIVIYDKKGHTIASATYIGPLPLGDIPIGLLKSSDKGFKSVTWQPVPNVRLAAVVVSAHDYYVVSARSLREVEKRESTLFWLTSLGWILSVVILGKVSLLQNKR